MQEKLDDLRVRKPLTDDEGEVRELRAADFASFRPAVEVLPESLAGKLGIQSRDPNARPIRVRISLRLSRDVIERFRAAGDDWEARLDAALREWLDTHPRI